GTGHRHVGAAGPGTEWFPQRRGRTRGAEPAIISGGQRRPSVGHRSTKRGIDHPIIDFHAHVRGTAPLASISTHHPLYSASRAVANFAEPLLYKVVQQVAYHLRHPF